MSFVAPRARHALQESRFSGLEHESGGNLHLQLNINPMSRANTYPEGKVNKDFVKRVNSA